MICLWTCSACPQYDQAAEAHVTSRCVGPIPTRFGKIIGQMQFDLFHAYTVDAHTTEVIANTRRFMRADYTDRFPVSTRIARRLRDPRLLYIAALFHDIGKGRGGDHSELGAVDAETFCRSRFIADRHRINRLAVKNHLLMSKSPTSGYLRPRGNPALRRDCRDGGTPRLSLYADRSRYRWHQPRALERLACFAMRQLYTETRRA